MREIRRPGLRDWIPILVVFAGAVFGAAWLGRSSNLGAAAVITGGTVVLAVLTRPFSRLPRWATLLSVGILGVSALGGAALWADTGAWHHALKDSLWMHPWYVLTLVGAAGSSCGGACGPGSRLFAWVYVGVAFFIGVVVPAVTVLF